MSSKVLPSSAPLYSASTAGSNIRGRAARCFLTPPPSTGFQGPYVAPAWDDPPSLAYGYPEELLIPPVESDLYPDDPADEFYADDILSSDLGNVGLEASELLFKYLGDTYKPAVSSPAGEAPTSASDSGFFQPSTLPCSGITVPSDFLSEFDRIAALAGLKSAPAALSLSFPVADAESRSHFDLEAHSPELLALADECPAGNPLKTKSFRSEDARWKFVSSASRHSLRLAAYSTALSDLLCRADELGVSPEDRRSVADILASISESLLSQSARVVSHTVQQRRRLALTALGLEKYTEHFSSRSVPVHGPFLFGGKFMEAVDQELTIHKRASDIARRLAPLTSYASKRGNLSPFKRPFSGGFPSAKRFAPSRGRQSFRGFRGSRFSRARSSHPSQSFPPPPPPPSPSPSDYARDLFPGPVGGRLCLFLSAWQTITQDPFILSVQWSLTVFRFLFFPTSPEFCGKPPRLCGIRRLISQF